MDGRRRGSRRVVLALASAVGLALPAAANAGTFTPTSAVSDGAAPAMSAATDANVVGAAAAVWIQGGTSGGTVQAASLPGGSLGWSAPQALATLGTAIGRPAVAIDGAGDALAVWTVREGQASFVRASWHPAAAPAWSPAMTLETGSAPVCRTPHTTICDFGAIVDASVDASPSGLATVAWGIFVQRAPAPGEVDDTAQARTLDVDLSTGAVGATQTISTLRAGNPVGTGPGGIPFAISQDRELHVAAADGAAAISFFHRPGTTNSESVWLASRAGPGAWATQYVGAARGLAGGECCASLAVDPGSGAATLLYTQLKRRFRPAHGGMALAATAPSPGVLVGPQRLSTPDVLDGPLARGVIAQAPGGRQTVFLADQVGRRDGRRRAVVALSRSTPLDAFGSPQEVAADATHVPFGAVQGTDGSALVLLATPIAPTAPDSQPGLVSVSGSVTGASWQPPATLDAGGASPALAPAGDGDAVATWLSSSARLLGARYAAAP